MNSMTLRNQLAKASLKYAQNDESPANQERPANLSAFIVDPASYSMLDLVNVLSPQQREVFQHPARVKVVAHGRRWGETVLGACILKAWAHESKRVLWLNANYGVSRLDRGVLGDIAPEIPEKQIKRIVVNQDPTHMMGLSVGKSNCVLVSNVGMMVYELRLRTFLFEVISNSNVQVVIMGTPLPKETESIFQELFLLADTSPQCKNWTFSSGDNGVISQDELARWSSIIPENRTVTDFYGRFPKLEKEGYYTIPKTTP